MHIKKRIKKVSALAMEQQGRQKSLLKVDTGAAEEAHVFGFCPQKYRLILMFQNCHEMKEAMEHNKEMEIIMGADEYSKSHFFGVCICGITSNEPMDSKQPV